MSKLLKFLSSFLLIAGLALAQPSGGGPGPGPQPNPWVQNGSAISYSGCLTLPSTVTGGCKGAGTINAAGLYVNGANAISVTSVFGRSGAVTAQNGDYSFSLISGTNGVSQGGTGLTAGISGGIPYYSSNTTMASSALLASGALVLGGGAAAAPSSTTTATGIVTWIGTPSSANLRAALTDETGTGAAFFAGGNAGAFTATSLNGNFFTAGTGTLTLGAGKTFTASNTLTLTGTDGSSLAIGAGGTLSAMAYSTDAANLSGTVAAARLPAFTGDVTTSAGTAATTIAANAVTNAKAAQMVTNTMKGNWTSSTANAADNAMASCPDTGSNHLNYVTNTGITCGTSAPAFSAAAGTVVAATTTNLTAATNTVQTVTGNTTITSFGSGANTYRILNFTGAPLLTYNASSLITPTGQNIQAAPGDSATLISDGSGNWTITGYTPYGGILTSTFSGVSSVGASYVQFGTVALTPGKWEFTASAQSRSISANEIRGAISTTTASSAGTTSGITDFSVGLLAAAGIAAINMPTSDATVTTNTNYFFNVRTDIAGTSFSGLFRAKRIYLAPPSNDDEEFIAKRN